MEINSNTVIVLTGASSGVGRAMALLLAEKQPVLVLAARRLEALEEVAKECRQAGATVHVVPTDTRNAAAMAQLAATASAITGDIDVWINNAGVLAAGALESVPAEINEAVIGTNLIGYLHGAQQAVTHFKKQQRGILINNISIGGWLPTPYATAYSASKFGIRGFTEALQAELSSFPNIHVVNLMPAFLDTPGIQHAANYTGKVLQPAPPVGDPRQVAKAVLAAIMRPRPMISIGIPAVMLRSSYAMLPALTRKITGWVIRRYLGQANAISETSGNILQPVAFGTSIDGGWIREPAAVRKSVIAGLAVAFSVGAVVAQALSRRRQ